jgi:hypothetical protein
MGQLAVAGGGAAVGAIAGSIIPGVGTMLGAQIGWALGGVAGALLFPPAGKSTEGPRLSDLAVQTSGYGVPIPCVAGITKIAGNVIWATEIEERKTVRRQGKGGPTAKTTTYTYYQSFAVGFAEWLIPPASDEVLRIWLDTVIVYDTKGGSEVTQIPGLVWRWYGGSETQLPDPAIEAAEGEDAPAHRGLAYMVFEDLPLDRFGNRMPNVTVEFVSNTNRSFTQVATVDPDTPIWPSAPAATNYVAWGNNVAVDHARGRIYEGRSRTSGLVGNANDTMIRVYDLTTMETIGEYPMGDMVAGLFPDGVTPTTASVGPGIMHMAADGYLYVTGGTTTRVPLWKISPDTWTAVDVFGPPEGAGNGWGDNGTRLIFPMQIKSFQVPRIGMTPRTFVVVQGAYTTSLIIDADFMEYVWGAGDVAIEPPIVPLNLSISPLAFPVQIVPGRLRDDGGVELFCLRAYSTPGRIEVARYRIYSGAVNLGGGTAMGIFRDDDMTIDLEGDVSAGATTPTLQGVWFDYSDDTLVITVAGAGSAVIGYSGFSTFKWAPGGAVVWAQVNHALPGGHDGRGDMGRVLGAYWGMAGNLYLQAASGDTIVNATGTDFQNLYWLDERQAVIGYTSSSAPVTSIAKRYLNRLAAVDLSVADVIEAIAMRAGMAETDIDVSAIDEPLRGYVLARPMSARDAIAPLAAYVQADAAEIDDVLTFVPRGGAVAATIAYDDMIREDPSASVLEEQRAQDAELPREVTVRYLDIERGWEQNAQSWRRPVSPTPTVSSAAVAAIDLPIPLVADEAKTVAKIMCVATWRERTRMTVSVGPQHARLVPTDAVTIETRDGASIRARVLNTQLGANWITRIECTTEDAAAYSLTATGDNGSGWVESVIPMPYAVRLMLPDMALPYDGDDMGQEGLREYAFAGSYTSGAFRGASVYRSPDASAWSELGFVDTSATWGALVETPGEPATPWTWDEVNTLEVRLEEGDLESATAAEVLTWANLGALVSPDGQAELVQWRDATALGGGRYSLSGLLRGRRGTEDLIASRAAGNTFILIDGQALLFNSGTSLAAATFYHRAVTLYDTVETAPATVAKSARGRAEKPYAPAQIAGARDGGDNLTITWLRRTRVGGEWLNGTGTVPVSEDAEAYEVEIMDGDDVVRTITGLSSPTAPYSAANQTTDFGSPQSSVAVRVYQISGIVGRGVAAEATV